MTIKVNLPLLILSLLAGAVAISTVAGSLQRVIQFQDPLNEMALALMAATLSTISLFSSIQKIK